MKTFSVYPYYCLILWVFNYAILINMNRLLLDKALSLPTADRIELIEALWDTLHEDDLPVTEEERHILDTRLSDMEAHPNDQSPWSAVKARLARRRS